MKTRRVKVNINDYVWVRLTKEGRGIHYEHYKDIYPILLKAGYGIPAMEEEDGWAKYQMWHFMQIFGSSFRMGMGGPIETSIEIEVEDLKEK